MRLLVTLFIAFLASGAADAAPVDSPYLRPEFRRLMNAVTLHVSFDAGHMRPDMAEGPAFVPIVFGSRKKEFPEPQFTEGLIGRGLLLGTGGANYPRPRLCGNGEFAIFWWGEASR